MTVTLYILCYFALFKGGFTYQQRKFPYSKCSQVGDKTKCTEVNLSKGSQVRQSKWPPGPYALPMSKFGCPETKSQGWDRGYLKFSWDMPHSVYATHEMVDQEKIIHANLSQFTDVLNNEWPNSQSFIHGPYDAYSWKINFCVKTRHSVTLDTGHWLPGQYQIYRNDKKCPQGFENVNWTMNLTGNPKLSRRGYLPDYEIIPDGFVTFHMCRRIMTTMNFTEQNGQDGVTDTVFAVVREGGKACPVLGSHKAVQETLICALYRIGIMHIDMMQSYCHFMPNISGVSGHYWQRDSASNSVLMSYIWKTTGVFPTSTGQYQWLQLDFKRSLIISSIEIEESMLDSDSLLHCFYDDAKMSFLHFEATSCHEDRVVEHKNLILYFRNIQARFMTFVLKRMTRFDTAQSLSVRVNDFENSAKDVCNNDLGMEDGSIQDFQITASSWLPEFMPSAARPSGHGWCAQQTDETPWIMVDLVAVTRIEGVNIFNWEERMVRRMSSSWNNTGTCKSFVKNKGILAFEVFHGVKKYSLKREMESVFHLDPSLPITDEQTFMFMMPINARFVKLYILESLCVGSRCMKFELRGCKMSGIPSLNCTNSTSSMFNVQTSVRPVELGAVKVYANNSMDCENICSELKNCSATHYKNGACLHYPPSRFNHWQYQTNTNENWAIKICAQDSIEIFPPADNMANVQSLMSDSPTTQIITSIGYPFTNAAGQMYKWRIDFDRQFISIAFTNVSMRNESTRLQPCYDKLHLAKYLQTDRGKEINADFNGRTFYIETSDSIMWLTFISCKPSVSETAGFRAIVTTGEPGCLQIDSSLPWSSARNEICDKPQMFLTSMSMLNFPYLNIEERWQIHAERWRRVRLQILEFYVVCPSGDLPSIFKVINYPDEDTYCNNNIPPDVLYSNTETLIIVFNRRQELSHVLRTEGFRVHYEIISDNLFSLTDLHLPTKECSSKMNKCYTVYYGSYINWITAAENCRTKQRKLVTIHSEPEMQYVVRQLQMYGGISVEKWQNMSYEEASAHIGLYRYEKDFGRKQDTWEGKEPVTYTAWDIGQPKSIGCTKLTFRSRFSKRSWRSADCDSDLVDYYVCEETYKVGGQGQGEVTDTGRCEIDGWLEAGQIKHNIRGKRCQRWSRDDRFKGLNLTEKTCQDPLGLGFLWCRIRTDNYVVISEPCFLSLEDAKYMATNSTGKPTNSNCLPGTPGWTVIRCDGKFDCDDKSDEISCEDVKKYHYLFNKNDRYTTTLTSLSKASYFQCSNSEWVSILSHCDGVIDCLDSSDELTCPLGLQGCADNEFLCDDGECLHSSKVCDYVPDCVDASDEFCTPRDCGTNEFACDNGQCIPLSSRCNAIPNCIDKTDETFCESCRVSFHCDAVRCIPERLVCDNYVDCEDGTDESWCFKKIFESCEELWSLGYHKSGQYQLYSYASEVYCDFTHVRDERKMRIILPNTDLFRNTSYLGSTRLSYLSSGPGITSDVELAISTGYKCSTGIQLKCTFAQSVVNNITSHDRKQEYSSCGCTVIQFSGSVGYREVYRNIRPCDGINMLEENGLHVNIGDDPLASSPFNFRLPLPVGIWPTETVLRRIDCTKNYEDVTMNEVFECDGSMLLIPSSMRCMFDIDAAGYMVGCRTGSHLANCEDFVCPEGTVKCPGSYCLPQGFICDGEKQCEDGADELYCFCENTKREVIILMEDTPASHESSKFATYLANRFYTEGSIIRLLKYKTHQPLYAVEHKTLEIREEHILPYLTVKQTEYCTYMSYARNFVKYVKFSIPDINGIVFIEDSTESAEVASLMFSKIRERPELKIYRVRRIKNVAIYKSHTYRYVTDISVRRWNVLSSVGYKYFAEICQATSDVPCNGKYRCSASKQCISLDKICDGVSQCIHGDDEKFCDFSCPQKCQCKGYTVQCDKYLTTNEAINMLPRQIRSLDISQNLNFSGILADDHLVFDFALSLNLSNCSVHSILQKSFLHLRNLLILDISYNKFTTLPANAFISLKHLKELKLDGNFNLQSIKPSTFRGLTRLRNLVITGTQLKRIESYSFSGLSLSTLDISNNELQGLEGFAFSGLSVQYIKFDSQNIDLNQDIFTGVFDLRVLRTPAFKFCCLRPSYVEEHNCYPTKDEFSSCEDLMRLSVLQTMLWFVGIASLLGNVGSIVYRLVFDRERLKIGHGIFVTNLAVSDFLMGVYLIIIAVADSIFRNRYIYMDDNWRNSVWCTIAGVLSFVSSEASVLFVCLITIDRLLVVKYPFGQVRFTPKTAHICCVISWSVASALALIPVLDRSYFDNEFYTRSGVCVALPLTRNQPPGWEYSVSIFVGLNFFTFILVAFGQLTIFLELRKSKSITGKSRMSRKRDLQVARNLIVIASTDFLCWFPIGLMGLMALSGYPVPGEVYAWTVVFILPFNSALNPFLYTVTAILGKKTFNPNAKEQISEQFFTVSELGTRILKFQAVSRYVKQKNDYFYDEPEVQKLDDILQTEFPKSPISVVTFARLLARYLYVLHASSVVIDKLSANNVYLAVDEYMMCRFISIDSKTRLTRDVSEIHMNMYQFGVILRKFISKK